MRITLLALSLIGLFLGPMQGEDQEKQPLPPLDSSLHEELASYISAHHLSPADYVIEKFADHDIVILGEFHRIMQQAELVHNLIPILYQNGIYNLGYEFACYSDQSLLDSLLATDEYDEALAHRIMFNQWPYMGYREYIDIYKVAWEVNRNRPKDAKKFRIIGLNSKADFSILKNSEDYYDPGIMRKVRPEGPRDSVMAVAVMREIVEKSEKGLIFCGFGHAFTRYHWPANGPIKCSAFTDSVGTMGNIIFDKIGDRCMNILLHSPWQSLNNPKSKLVYPADGIIDTLMLTLEKWFHPAGFDIVGTPFAELTGESAYWSIGKPDFRLVDYCDGYIYLCPLSEYEGISVAEGFFTEENRLAVIMQSGNPESRDTTRTIEQIIASMARDADMKRRFRNFK